MDHPLFNDITGNGTAAVENHTVYNVDAKNNWWGDDVTALMEQGDNPKNLNAFQDSHDNNSYGLINYAGWLDGTALDPGNPPTASPVITGTLTLTDADGLQTPTYQSGDNLQVHLSDSDANTDASTAETLTVLVTSETEDTGTPFSATTPTAAVGNTGLLSSVSHPGIYVGDRGRFGGCCQGPSSTRDWHRNLEE